MYILHKSIVKESVSKKEISLLYSTCKGCLHEFSHLGQPVLKYSTIYEGFLVKSEPASKKLEGLQVLK